MILALAAAVGARLQLAQPIANPCGSIECGDLQCSAASKVVSIPGHCCPYCELTGSFKDMVNYKEHAMNAFNSYETAPYGGGYPSGTWKNKAERPVHGIQ